MTKVEVEVVLASASALRVIISAGRPDVGLALAPAGIVAAMGAQVSDLCEDE